MFGLVVLACCSSMSMASAAPPEDKDQSWIQIPTPDSVALEPAVAEQLERLREFVRAELGNSQAAPAELAAAFGELARHYHAYEMTAVALESYRIAHRLAPQDFRWTYLQAFLLQNEGRLEEAAELYQKSLDIVPNVAPAWIRWGHIELDLNRPERAAAHFGRALQLDPTSAAAKAGLGQLLLAEKRYDEAAKILEETLTQQPEASQLYYPLALAYRGLGNLDKAQELLALRGEVGIRPADPLVDGLVQLTTGERVHLLRGRAAFAAGDYQTAEEEFSAAVAAETKSISARLNLAAAQAQVGKVDAAIENLERVVELAPGNATAHFNLSILYRQSGRPGEALASLEAAASYAPKDAEIQFQLGDAMRASGKLEAALLHYGKAVSIDPSLEFARVSEADVLARLGRYPEALNRLETALKLMPSSGSVAHALARLLAASPDLSLRDGVRAVRLSEKVFETAPTVSHLRTLALAYAEAGACEEAAHWVGVAIEQATTAGEVEVVRELTELLPSYQIEPPCRPPAG